MIGGKNTKSTCRVCGQKGRRAQILTIRSLLKEESLSAIRDDDYFFCANHDCAVIYYAASKNSLFLKDKLKIRVGLKEKTPPRTLCYCFGHTIEDVHGEILKKGKSTVERNISDKIEAGLCHCEDANPEGRCCLGRVAVAVREGFRLLGARKGEAHTPVTTSSCCKCEI